MTKQQKNIMGSIEKKTLDKRFQIHIISTCNRFDLPPSSRSGYALINLSLKG